MPTTSSIQHSSTTPVPTHIVGTKTVPQGVSSDSTTALHPTSSFSQKQTSAALTAAGRETLTPTQPTSSSIDQF
eukprot:m.10260 g.10260  ORF g.10260 m.10260 type:complete len:74 (-) comp8211_c0_seq1:96-317(-)